MTIDGLDAGRVAQDTQFATVDGAHVKGVAASAVGQLEVAGSQAVGQSQVKLERALIHLVVEDDAHGAGLAWHQGHALTAHAVVAVHEGGHAPLHARQSGTCGRLP